MDMGQHSDLELGKYLEGFLVGVFLTPDLGPDGGRCQTTQAIETNTTHGTGIPPNWGKGTCQPVKCMLWIALHFFFPTSSSYFKVCGLQGELWVVPQSLVSRLFDCFKPAGRFQLGIPFSLSLHVEAAAFSSGYQHHYFFNCLLQSVQYLPTGVPWLLLFPLTLKYQADRHKTRSTAEGLIVKRHASTHPQQPQAVPGSDAYKHRPDPQYHCLPATLSIHQHPPVSRQHTCRNQTKLCRKPATQRTQAEMSGSTLNEQGTIVVISDLHVGADWLHQNAKDRIIELIGKITGRVGTGPQLIPHPQCVVFAGDIVDLWVHKRTVEPPTFEKLWREDPFGQLLMNAINDLLNANIHVVYIAGNHDMKATKADIDQLFGADRIEFVAQNNCWMSDGPVNREGRVIVAHGHQCDLFNRPVPSGGRADDLPFGYFVSRLAATTGKTQTLSWIQRLALGYLPNMVWEDVANRMLTAPPVRTLISSAPQRAMKENLWFMLECRLLKEAGKLTLDETNLDDWNRELNEIDFKLPGGLTMTLGEVLHDYESIYVSGQGTGATQMTPTQTVVHWIVDRAIGLMRNTSPTPQENRFFLHFSVVNQKPFNRKMSTVTNVTTGAQNPGSPNGPSGNPVVPQTNPSEQPLVVPPTTSTVQSATVPSCVPASSLAKEGTETSCSLGLFQKEKVTIHSAIPLDDVCTKLASPDCIWKDLTLSHTIGSEEATKIAQALASNQSLTHLDLSRNLIGNEGVTVIAGALKSNNSLRHLNLHNNEIGNEGAIGIARGLASNKSLERLDLSNNQIGNDGATSIAELLGSTKSLTRLDLSGNQIWKEGAASIAQYLKLNKSLAHLDLSQNPMENCGAVRIADALLSNQSLAHLNLSFTQMEDEGAIRIAAALKSNKSLVSLYLGRNRIRNAGAIKIAEALKVNQSLLCLDFKGNKIEKEGAIMIAEALQLNNSLVCLNLSWNQIGNDGMTSIVQALGSNKSLACLDLAGNQIGNAGATSLVNTLQSNKSLLSLDLSCNQIDSEGASSIAEALCRNQSLMYLDLNCNKTGNKGANSVAQALKTNTSLVRLCLSCTQIDAEGGRLIAEALAVNTQLVRLDLAGNKIGNDGAISIAGALASNKSLQSLNISSNGIEDEGANKIAEALKLNKSLTHLDLSGNQVVNEGAAGIAQALTPEYNNSLTHLDLHENEIGNEGATKIAHTLESNRSLTHLDLSSNDIGTVGATAIAEALISNNSLWHLDLSCNKIGLRADLSISHTLRSRKNGSLMIEPSWGTHLFWFTCVTHPFWGASLLVLASTNSKIASIQSCTPLSLISNMWLAMGVPENKLPGAQFSVPEVRDLQNGLPSLYPSESAIANGHAYFDNHFSKSPLLAEQCAAVNMIAPIKDITGQSQQLETSSSISSTCGNTQEIRTLPLVGSPSVTESSAVAPQPDTISEAVTPPASLVLATTIASGTPNTNTAGAWLESIDKDYLKIIAANQLRRKALANCSLEGLRNLGLTTDDAALVIEEAKNYSSGYRLRSDVSPQNSTSSYSMAAKLGSGGHNYKCFAFVVGNQSYKHYNCLKNALNDADKVTEFFRDQCGYETCCYHDIKNFDELDTEVRRFQIKMETARSNGKVASIFYFAGHGKQVAGHNLLLMTEDLVPSTIPWDILCLQIPVFGKILKHMRKASDLTIGILDCCRDSSDSSGRIMRATGSGEPSSLAKEDFLADCILVYPVSPGRTTLDFCPLDTRRSNGFFTGCFLEVVESALPGTPWNELESRIIEMVQKLSFETARTPWISKSCALRFALF
ncbi:Protein NLRC3 [Pelomyxa schiedti]|nr:Protein NLRC3 [Pelomyxa schiedti]